MITKEESTLLIVDDDIQFLDSIELVLQTNGFNKLHLCNDSREVLRMVGDTQPDLVLLDLTMPYMTGDKVLSQIKEHFPELPVVILTALNDVDTAVLCTKLGAYDYLLKPIDEHRLKLSIDRALEYRSLSQENNKLKNEFFYEKLKKPELFSSIITQNTSMLSLFKYMEMVALSPQPVLITGETGSGKELFAKAIHDLSERKGEYVIINVAGLDDNIFSDTLFGHHKGAYTGADTKREGLISKAQEGTLFLDEIGDLSPMSQVKLLRLLQSQEYYPLGSDSVVTSSARVICATNIPAQELKENKEFRTDLFYRLRAHHIHIPPLRDRIDDLPQLLEHFFAYTAEKLNKKVSTVPKGLVELLSTYTFPGNIRELEAMVFDAMSNHQSKKFSLEVFKVWLKQNEAEILNPAENIDVDSSKGNTLFTTDKLPTIKQATEKLIEIALEKTSNNYGVTSQMLGISRQTLYRFVKKVK